MLAGLMGVTNLLDAPHCVTLAAAATALILIWPDVLPAAPALNPAPTPTHRGARRELPDLSWSVFDGQGGVSDKALNRLRTMQGPPLPDHPSAAEVRDWLDKIEQRRDKHDTDVSSNDR